MSHIKEVLKEGWTPSLGYLIKIRIFERAVNELRVKFSDLSIKNIFYIYKDVFLKCFGSSKKSLNIGNLYMYNFHSKILKLWIQLKYLQKTSDTEIKYDTTFLSVLQNKT